jgi:dCMP deaminase
VPRPEIHTYLMNIAREVSTRSTCTRKQVGAVIVRDRNILSTGYNGSMPGMPHCDEEACDVENGHCVATVHAEANAIAQAAKHGTAVKDSVLYTTASPCWLCFKLIVNAGIREIWYHEAYHLEARVLSAAKKLKIKMKRV